MALKKVIFRGDANSKIGWGHLSRLVSIANYCLGGYYRILVVNNYEKELDSLIKDKFDEIIVLNLNEIDLYSNKEIDLYINLGDVIVLDGYNFNSDYQRLLKKKKKKIIYIDDLISFDYHADVIINHAIGIEENKYKIQNYSKLYLGSNYLMLRDDFINYKPQLNIRNNKTLLICFGGADPNNFTQKTLDICSDITDVNIKIILGASNQSFNGNVVKKNIIVLNNLDTNDLIKEMTNASVFICSASTIAYEACSLGVPLLVVKTADNQQSIYNGLISNKCAIAFDFFNKTNSLKIVENILCNKELRIEMYNKQVQLFKGDIKSNFLNIFDRLYA